MKILFLSGYSTQERKIFKEVIFSNIILSMRALVVGAEKLQIALSAESQQLTQLFKAHGLLFEQQLSPERISAINVLWNDPGIRQALARSAEYQLNDCAEYFLTNIERISGADYVPTEQDILYARARTSGIIETTFPVEGTVFRMVDVGGQRSERKKWIHCFQQVMGLIFCVAISEYDQKLYEDDQVNRLHEAIVLFDEICNCGWFAKTSIILFLNKADLFKAKIEKVDLKVCFPDYKGGCNYEAGTAFLTDKFRQLNKNPGSQIFTHITTATDTSNIKFVFNAVREILLGMALDKIF